MLDEGHNIYTVVIMRFSVSFYISKLSHNFGKQKSLMPKHKNKMKMYSIKGWDKEWEVKKGWESGD